MLLKLFRNIVFQVFLETRKKKPMLMNEILTKVSCYVSFTQYLRR